MNGFVIYLCGFSTCAVIWACWHFGVIQPRLRALRDLAEDRLKHGKTPVA